MQHHASISLRQCFRCRVPASVEQPIHAAAHILILRLAHNSSDYLSVLIDDHRARHDVPKPKSCRMAESGPIQTFRAMLFFARNGWIFGRSFGSSMDAATNCTGLPAYS